MMDADDCSFHPEEECLDYAPRWMAYSSGLLLRGNLACKADFVNYELYEMDVFAAIEIKKHLHAPPYCRIMVA